MVHFIYPVTLIIVKVAVVLPFPLLIYFFHIIAHQGDILLLNDHVIVFCDERLSLRIIEQQTVDATVKAFDFNVIDEVPLDDHHTSWRLLHNNVNFVWV